MQFERRFLRVNRSRSELAMGCMYNSATQLEQETDQKLAEYYFLYTFNKVK